MTIVLSSPCAFLHTRRNWSLRCARKERSTRLSPRLLKLCWVRASRSEEGNGVVAREVAALASHQPDDVSGGCFVDPQPPSEQQRTGSDLQTLFRRLSKVGAPYWSSDDQIQARIRLAGVFALTLATTGISVGFNFLGRDFYNALASKDKERFMMQLLYYLGAFVGGIPVFVMRDYLKEKLALRWRAWMTKYYMGRYFDNRTFYDIQSQSLIDNPDQRIVDDLNAFTATALSFALALFNSAIDLISFSSILYSIYPPLFGVLIVYSLGGTAISVALGKGLVGLNFMQEKREADFRYSLVRVRENAESIAFYGGELNEMQLLLKRFKQSFNNYSKLLIASRNLDFFTSGYRYLIQLLPAAVVAPLYFSGKIEFGVINQSFSAFNHILGDFSVIVFQFQSISAFSAVVDRLGEFNDVLEEQNAEPEAETSNPSEGSTSVASQICLIDDIQPRQPLGGVPLLEIENLTLRTPQNSMTLVENLSLAVHQGEHLLITGASGSGKTSILRAIAGLWRSGEGTIKRRIQPAVLGNTMEAEDVSSNGAPSSRLDFGLGGQVFFVPQTPYMVLGSLREQMLYPTWTQSSANNSPPTADDEESIPFFTNNLNKDEGARRSIPTSTPRPADDQLISTLEKVQLEHLLARCDGLDSTVEWSNILSLGEQQRLAFARLLLSRPTLALLDESTSALDESNEARMYTMVEEAGVTVVSVGHRSSLRQYHNRFLELRESRKWWLGSTKIEVERNS